MRYNKIKRMPVSTDTMIVKIQSQQSVPIGPVMMLIYDEDRDFEHEIPLTSEVKKLLKGRPKAYFEAKVVGSKLEILKEVQPQNW